MQGAWPARAPGSGAGRSITSHTFSTSTHRHSAFQENPPFVFSYTPYAPVTQVYYTPPVMLPPSPSAEALYGPYTQTDAIMDEPNDFRAEYGHPDPDHWRACASLSCLSRTAGCCCSHQMPLHYLQYKIIHQAMNTATRLFLSLR